MQRPIQDDPSGREAARRGMPAVRAPVNALAQGLDWLNDRRLLEPIGNIPPAEAEANHHAALEQPRMAA